LSAFIIRKDLSIMRLIIFSYITSILNTFFQKRLFFFFFLCSCIAISQNETDSLRLLDIDTLLNRYRASKDVVKKEAYANAALQKSKTSNNTLSVIQSYHMLALIYKDEKTLKYCDSIIYLSKDLNDSIYPTTAYLIKGNRFYLERNFKKAIDNYLDANEYATKNYNKRFVIQSNYSIAILRDLIGEHEIALELHQKNYFESKNDVKRVGVNSYLAYIFALANSYNELKVLDSASYYNNLGVKQSLEAKSSKDYNHFVLNEGVTLFYKERFVRSLDSINKALPYFETSDDAANRAIGYFYKGNCLLKLGKDNEALGFFKKVDSIFLEDYDLMPKLRGAYEFLIRHYKEEGDQDKQLTYIERLISFDSILNSNEVYINKNIIKLYDIPELISEKERLISNLETSKKTSWKVISGLSILTSILLLGFYYQYKKRKLYKKRFLDIINTNKSNDKEKHVNVKQNKPELNIAEDIIDTILKGLNKFETQEQFLKQGTNLQDLSKSLKTNANYLSKVVNHYKEKSFINYINDLRIDFAMQRLQDDSLFRQYTIKAVANDVGFKNSESFSKAFHKKAGIKPSYFIRELEKHQKKQ